MKQPKHAPDNYLTLYYYAIFLNLYYYAICQEVWGDKYFYRKKIKMSSCKLMVQFQKLTCPWNSRHFKMGIMCSLIPVITFILKYGTRTGRKFVVYAQYAPYNYLSIIPFVRRSGVTNSYIEIKLKIKSYKLMAQFQNLTCLWDLKNFKMGIMDSLIPAT